MTDRAYIQQLPTNRLIDLLEVTRVTTLKKTKIYELIKSGEIHPTLIPQ